MLNSKEINKPVRELLRGTLISEGFAYAVYNKTVPVGVTDNVYVLIQQQVNRSFNTMVCRGYNHLVTLQIVERSRNGTSSLSLDAAAGSLLNILSSFLPNELPTGDKILFSEIENDVTIDGLTDGEKVVTLRNITLNFIIHLI